MKNIALLLLILTSLCSAQQKVSTDFLASLDDICVEDDGVFKNCDELYSKDGSALFFIIIPKIGAQKWYTTEVKGLKGATYEKNNVLTGKIQKINKADLSKQFDVWVFYTDKKYTTRVDMDNAYNLKTPRITTLYYLKSGKDNWEKQDDFEVKTEADDAIEITWQSNFIDKAIRLSNAKK